MVKKEFQNIKKKVSFLKRFFKKGASLCWGIFAEIYFAGGYALDDLTNFRWEFKGLRDLYWWPYDLYLQTKIKEKPSFEKNRLLKVSIKRLIKAGLLKKEGGKIKVTSFGKELMNFAKEHAQALKKWDGKIRLVIFDIPEEKAHFRELIRDQLKLLGYKYLQKSVYIGKAPLPVSFYQNIKKLKLEKEIFIFIVQAADKEDYILSKLGLLK